MHLDAKAIASALGGYRCGSGFLARCPSHDDRSPSLSLQTKAVGCSCTATPAAPRPRCWKSWKRVAFGPACQPGDVRPLARPSPARRDTDEGDRVASALQPWAESEDPRGTLAERYLESRELALEDLAGRVLRFHRACRFGKDEAGAAIFRPCLVALFRDIRDDRPKGIHRIVLAPDGRGHLGKKMLGPVGRAAIKLDDDAEVTYGLGVCEGLETGMSVRAAGWRPVWALGSAGAIKAFPVIPGIESITIFADNDPNGTGLAAGIECAKRWHEAGCKSACSCREARAAIGLTSGASDERHPARPRRVSRSRTNIPAERRRPP